LGTHEDLAKLIYECREAGIDLGNFTVSAEGVYFETHGPAKSFAERHNKELKRVDGWISGWLAKNKD
jgi:hypothetical protein